MVPRILAVLVAALVAAPAAAAAPPAPKNLRAFLLGANEPQPAGGTFSRTPSFAWNQVRGATRYEFELSTSQSFAQNAIVWRKANLTGPLTTVPVTLPWTTGSQFSFYARVRARIGRSAGPWSARYGFRLRAPQAPASLSDGPNPRPGLVRWTPVEGATAYEVTLLYDLGSGEKKLVRTQTTAADLREYYTFHNTFPALAGVLWRVRAVREVEGTTSNRLPAVSYGPWSAYSFTTEPLVSPGTVEPLGAISRSRNADVVSTPPGPGSAPHELVPGFWWSGNESLLGLGACPPEIAGTNVTCPLYHVYVYTDEDCVNRVHVSDLVGSPAYAPRLSKPLALPSAPNGLAELYTPEDPDAGTPERFLMLGDGSEGLVYDAGGEQVYAAGTDPLLPAPTVTPKPGKEADRRTGLWDNDWGDSRYYWTVVPAVPRLTPSGGIEYHDVEFGEDMCAAGLAGTFGKTSAPVAERASGVPFVSGVTPAGAVRGAASTKPSFFGQILVAWRPAPGASRYQVQWSRTVSPFRAAGTVRTPATSALLTLPTGVWYYRIRGLDHSIPAAAQGMTWTDPQYVRIVPRRFTVVGRR